MTHTPLQEMAQLMQQVRETPMLMQRYDDVATHLIHEYESFLPNDLFTPEACLQSYVTATGDSMNYPQHLLIIRALHYYLTEIFQASRDIQINEPLHANNARFVTFVKCSLILRQQLNDLD